MGRWDHFPSGPTREIKASEPKTGRYASVRPHRPCTFASGVLDPLGPCTTAAGPRQHTQPFRPPWLPSGGLDDGAPCSFGPRCRWRLGLAYVAARLAWRLGAVGRHAGAPPQPVRPPIVAHHGTPRSSRRADRRQLEPACKAQGRTAGDGQRRGGGAVREVFALARRCAKVLRMAWYRQGGQRGHEDGFSRAAETPSLRGRCPLASARAGQVGQAPPAAGR